MQLSLFVFVARVLQRFEPFERVEGLELFLWSEAIGGLTTLTTNGLYKPTSTS